MLPIVAKLTTTTPARSAPSKPRTLKLIVLATFLASPAIAQTPLEGRFQGRGEGRLDLQVYALSTDRPENEHLVIAETAIPNTCTGEVRGLARREGARVLRLRKPSSEPDQVCEVTLRYSTDGQRVAMSAERCGDFHGTLCDFAGSLKRR
ncbi:MAG: hypothetical protein K2X54_07970 [Methylobacterium organophilum]|jgi:hypothetical protein|nr:hypothetical protein [Methylobacterium organophilum]